MIEGVRFCRGLRRFRLDGMPVRGTTWHAIRHCGKAVADRSQRPEPAPMVTPGIFRRSNPHHARRAFTEATPPEAFPCGGERGAGKALFPNVEPLTQRLSVDRLAPGSLLRDQLLTKGAASRGQHWGNSALPAPRSPPRRNASGGVRSVKHARACADSERRKIPASPC